MNEARRCISSVKLPCILVIFILCVGNIALATTAFPLSPNRLAESWVLERVAAGKIANLKERFPDNETDRVLSARFLEDLLTNSLKDVSIHRRGVRISYAIVTEPIDLENAEIPYEVWLNNCRFESGVNFARGVFHKNLSFIGSSLQSANFNSVKVAQAAFFRTTTFAGSVNFVNGEIGSNFEADGSQFTHAEQLANFNSMKVQHTVLLNGARFAGPVNFSSIDIRSQLVAHGVQFTNPRQVAYFDSMKVGQTAFFNDAVFAGGINFFNAEIGGDFEANRVRFTNPDQNVQFNRMRVAGSVSLREAVFEGSTTFIGANIAVQLLAHKAQFTNPKSVVIFNSLKTGHSAFFHGAIFAGAADFGSANIGSNFEADRTRYTNPEQTADFHAMKVGALASFRKAIFVGAVDFASADIGNNFEADDARFTNPEQTAVFNGMKVGQRAFFRRAMLAGGADFGSVDLGNSFEADEAQFTNPKQSVSFNAMKTRQAVFFRSAIFAGATNFVNASIGSNFEADGAQFNQAEGVASFNGLKVGETAFFRGASFAGTADFRGMDVVGQLVVDGAKFTHPEKITYFNGMKVGDTALFRMTAFTGTVSMVDAALLDVRIQGIAGKPTLLQHLDLSRTVIRRSLRIEDVKLQDVKATSLRVEGFTLLNRVSIERDANLVHSSFLTLTLSEVSWPKTSKSGNLDGMSYQNITAGPRDSRQELSALIDHSAYSASVYANLETFFRRNGYPEEADKIYIAQQQRERREVLRWYSPKWWWNLFLDIFVKYGRSPGRALVWSALFIGAGVVVFWHKDRMELQKPEYAPRNYSSLWYSLDLFIPFVDLDAANIWAPKQDRRFAWFCVRILKVLGWILIPIGLAALMGLIK